MDGKCLVAQEYIQIGSIIHRPGDLLPLDDTEMVNAWIEAGTAVWMDLAEYMTAPSTATARLVTAMPGMSGLAVGGEATGDELVGRVPLTPERRKRPWKA